MPSTYTLNNGITLIATGEQSGSWGDTTNTNFQLVDTALDGQVSVTLASAGSSGSPNDLPISDGGASNGRNRMVIFGDGGDLGGTAFVRLTPNDAEKIIYVRNSLSGSRSILFFQGTYSASNDYEVPSGTTAVIHFNGAGSGAVAANVFNNAYFDSLRLGSVSVTAILDEDNMSSNSATAIPTQQSVKAYVDTQVGTVDTLAETLSNGNTTGGTNLVVTAGDTLSANTVSETTSASGVTVDSLLIKDGGITAAGTSTFAGQTITNLGAVTTADINGGTIDGATIGGSSAGAGTFTNLTATSADINGGTIDGATIGGSSAGAGTFTNLTATSADINGGTIDGATIGGSSAGAGTFTTLTATTLTAASADINGGTIDGATIGGASAGAGTFTTLTATSLNSTPVGNSSASTGAFTTLTASTNLNINSSVSVTGVLDEDNMASNSDVKLATQQSIKAYVDSQVGSTDTLAEVLAIGNSTGGTNLVVTAGDVITTNVISETTSASGVTIDGVVLKDTSLTTASNANLDLDPNGSGKVVFKGNSTKGAGQFVLNCELNSHGIVIKGPPHSAAASYTLTLPDDDGNANQLLKTDGSGGLGWVDAFSASNQTLATDGSTDLGSLQLRWGYKAISSSVTETVTFTSAFSNACLNVQITVNNNAAAASGIAADSLTSTQFYARISDTSVDGFYYFAVGH